MTRPGHGLRSFCAKWCSAETMARIVDPVIADFQAEWAAAERPVWRLISLWVVYAAALCRALLANAWAAEADRPTGSDRPALTRALLFALAATAAVCVILTAPQFLFGQTRFLFVLIPESLSLAIPTGVIVGLAMGFAGRDLSRRLRVVAVAMGFAGSVATFVVASWALPTGWRSYNGQATRPPMIYLRSSQTLRDPSEMTLVEMAAWLRNPRTSDGSVANIPTEARRLFEMRYCERVSISLASSSLAILALAVLTRRRFNSGWSVAFGVLSPVVFVAAFMGGEAAFESGLTAWTIVWLPNLACIGLAMLLVRTMESRAVATTTARCT